ncbi:MAG: OsmC family peroxiredoxin [Proteobacteria bacterium]|nr:OsmC family peroxiredoxin [Pseudomonadota bacterium]
MLKREAHAVWNGTGKEGKGFLTTQSATLKDTQYSFHSRFEDGKGTNPEELLAAAHAGCFDMALSFMLTGMRN